MPGAQAVLCHQRSDPSLVFCTPWPAKRLKDGRLIHDTMSPLWHRAYHALQIPTGTTTADIIVDLMPVDQARNAAVKLALTKWEKPPTFIFFIDWDVIVAPNHLQQLLYRAKNQPEYDVYAGVYCAKCNPPEPLIYDSWNGGPFWDWTIGDVLTTDQHGICLVHSGLTLVRTSVYQRMLQQKIVNVTVSDCFDGVVYPPWYKTVEVGREERSTDDVHFCKSLILGLGGKILVDTSVLAPHLDKDEGRWYTLPPDCGPVKRWKARQTEVAPCP